MRGQDLKIVDPQALPVDPAEDSAKRRQILDGARCVFMREGFDGASMNDIARAAGVSKGTLYVYFGSKEDLFEALIRAERREQAERCFAIDADDPDVAGVLASLATRLLEGLSKPQAVAHVRMVVGVAAKFPKVGRAYYEAGPLYGAETLAAYLARRVAEGRLAIDDPVAAAHQFFDSAKAGLIPALYFGLRDEIAPQEIEANVRRAVGLFMAYYGVRTGSTSPAA